MDFVDLDAEVDLTAGATNKISRMFPKLAGAELGIEEPLDQRGLSLLLSDAASLLRSKSLLEEVRHHALERKPFDALRAPFGADLIARHAPHLLGVRLEKRQVELFAEAVDDEILE